MKLMNSTNITDGVSYSAGYSNGCSLMIVHGKPEKIPEKEAFHYHTKDSEYFYVLNGTLTVNVNDSDTVLSKGQCLETEPGEIHKIVGVSNDVEYIIVRTNILPAEKVIVQNKKF